ncbi:hypothetical protein AB0D08_27160 [Kitasatospora sp. NPDC048540]|uniref:hypothetical protein n=1 Tax=unclassified Kitasatospora TaxID=2633591 RepID=UPI00053AD40E|nr:hypothetical protein [Kitasatospora sp. MBT63]
MAVRRRRELAALSRRVALPETEGRPPRHRIRSLPIAAAAVPTPLAVVSPWTKSQLTGADRASAHRCPG